MTDISLIPIIFFNAVATALYLVITSRFMKHGHGNNGQLHFIAAITYTHLPGGVALLCLWMWNHDIHTLTALHGAFLQFLLVSVAFNMLSKLMYFYAYAKTEVANVTIFSAFTPLFALLTGWYFLNERPDALAVAGILLTMAGFYYYYLKPVAGASLITNLLQPFRHTGSDRALLMAGLSTIPPAFSIVYSKKAIALLDPLCFTALQLLCIGLCSLMIECAALGPKGGYRPFSRQLPWRRIALLSLLITCAGWSASVAVTMDDIASIMSLQRIAMILQVLFAYILLKEKMDMRRKMLAVMLVFAGSLLILH